MDIENYQYLENSVELLKQHIQDLSKEILELKKAFKMQHKPIETQFKFNFFNRSL